MLASLVSGGGSVLYKLQFPFDTHVFLIAYTGSEVVLDKLMTDFSIYINIYCI